MKLYHTGRLEIRKPDIHHGRKNADFGWGFYLTPDLDFALRWGREGFILNEYELNETGLNIHIFERDEEWFSYIFNNRRGSDVKQADVIIGPIANDTIFETWGIISSGYLKPQEAMKLLMIGPKYTQVAIKTEKAVGQLKWLKAEVLEKPDNIILEKEKEEYGEAFGAALQEIIADL
jgi:hypothetical protein